MVAICCHRLRYFRVTKEDMSHMERVKILSSDTNRHLQFFGFVDEIFPGGRTETWTVWRDRGGWTADYEVFALVDDGTIVGTIGRSRMRLVIEGEDRVGYQLGAVATLERYRGQGLARRLMEWVIGSLDAADQPIILFANSRVHDFYPRFGFQRLPQRRSVATAALHPAGAQALRCDLSDTADRARLAALCARARPTRGRLTARDYGWLALWNLTCEPVTLAWVPDHDAAVAFAIEDGTLIVHDVLAGRPFDLRQVAPTLIAQPVAAVELLIDPEDFWPAMTHFARDDSNSPLFACGVAAAINGPVQFTPLAQT
jgi:predicted N-acetyltransferase YhbS